MARRTAISNADRSTISESAKLYFDSTEADPDLRTTYDRLFAPADAEQSAALDAHRAATVATEAEHANVVAKDERVDDVVHRIHVWVDVNHGKEGVRALNSLWGDRGYGALSRLPFAEEVQALQDFIRRVDGGAALEINVSLMAELRVAVQELAAALARRAHAEAHQAACSARLQAANTAFDDAWSRLVKHAKLVLGDELGRMAPDLG